MSTVEQKSRYAARAREKYRNRDKSELAKSEFNRKRLEYYYKNKEKIRENQRRYWRENPDKRQLHYTRKRERLEFNPGERLRRNELARQGAKRLRALVFGHYGAQCNCCGESHDEFLAIDHMNGCGMALRKIHGGGTSFYQWIKRNGFPTDFQVLCHNCNMAKALHGACPHKKEVVS